MFNEVSTQQAGCGVRGKFALIVEDFRTRSVLVRHLLDISNSEGRKWGRGRKARPGSASDIKVCVDRIFRRGGCQWDRLKTTAWERLRRIWQLAN